MLLRVARLDRARPRLLACPLWPLPSEARVEAVVGEHVGLALDVQAGRSFTAVRRVFSEVVSTRGTFVIEAALGQLVLMIEEVADFVSRDNQLLGAAQVHRHQAGGPGMIVNHSAGASQPAAPPAPGP